MRRDTIQGLIQAIESISTGIHRRRQTQRQVRNDEADAQRQFVHDTYAANQEARAAQSHERRMRGGDGEGPLAGLSRTFASVGIGSGDQDGAARQAATMALVGAGGDHDAALNSLTRAIEQLGPEPPAPDDFTDANGYEAVKAYRAKHAVSQKALDAMRAYAFDRSQAAPGQAKSLSDDEMKSQAQVRELLMSINQMAAGSVTRSQQMIDAAKMKTQQRMPVPPSISPSVGQPAPSSPWDALKNAVPPWNNDGTTRFR